MLDIQHLSIKYYTDLEIDLEALIPIFHSWIRDDVLKVASHEPLIDVADYKHVPAGPGIMLIGHACNYALSVDQEKKLGFSYSVKQKKDGTNIEKILHSLRRMHDTIPLLEKDLGISAFFNQKIKFTIADRHFAPNTAESYTALQSDFAKALQDHFTDSNKEWELVHSSGNTPKELFQIVASV